MEHGTFTPLVFTTSGGFGPAAAVVFKCLASLLAIKWNIHCTESGHLVDSVQGWFCAESVSCDVYRERSCPNRGHDRSLNVFDIG